MPMKCLTVLLLVVFAPLVRAEDLSADEEAAIMALEDETEAALPTHKKPPGSVAGRVQLKSDAVAEEGAVVGLLTAQDRAYLLRLSRPDVLPILQRFNGKTVTVMGKIRMQGKYLVAEGVQPPAPGIERKDRAIRSGM